MLETIEHIGIAFALFVLCFALVAGIRRIGSHADDEPVYEEPKKHYKIDDRLAEQRCAPYSDMPNLHNHCVTQEARKHRHVSRDGEPIVPPLSNGVTDVGYSGPIDVGSTLLGVIWTLEQAEKDAVKESVRHSVKGARIAIENVLRQMIREQEREQS